MKQTIVLWGFVVFSAAWLLLCTVAVAGGMFLLLTHAVGCVTGPEPVPAVIDKQEEATPGTYKSAWELDPVPGNKAADKGEEIVGFIGGADYRFLANDDSIMVGSGKDYFISDVVKQAGAFAWQARPGGYLVWASDFTSLKSGLHYKWVGFRLKKSASPMITDNPLVVSDGDMTGTFRAYWITVSGKLNGDVSAYNSGQYLEWAIANGVMKP